MGETELGSQSGITSGLEQVNEQKGIRDYPGTDFYFTSFPVKGNCPTGGGDMTARERA